MDLKETWQECCTTNLDLHVGEIIHVWPILQELWLFKSWHWEFLHAVYEGSERVTVNMVIFVGGKFRKNVGKIFHVGKFSQYYSYFLHKDIWVLFSRGGNSLWRRQKRKKRKNYSHVKIFTFNSFVFCREMRQTRNKLLELLTDPNHEKSFMEKAVTDYFSLLMGLIQPFEENETENKLRRAIKFKWTNTLLGTAAK